MYVCLCSELNATRETEHDAKTSTTINCRGARVKKFDIYSNSETQIEAMHISYTYSN